MGFTGEPVFFAVASALIQVLFSYSLQVIAEKNELPGFASFIAWIPLLQISCIRLLLRRLRGGR